jgi:hypothetical protein
LSGCLFECLLFNNCVGSTRSYETGDEEDSYINAEVTIEEVRNVIAQLSVGKSDGVDRLNAEFFIIFLMI